MQCLFYNRKDYYGSNYYRRNRSYRQCYGSCLRKTNDVAIIYKSSDEKACQLENELGCTAYKADVTSAKEVSAAVERIAADFGK